MNLEKAKPILFNTEMVRAILKGRKTCTRRIIKKNKIDDILSSQARTGNADVSDEKSIKLLIDSPYNIGDILYVRESWKIEEYYDSESLIVYKANGHKEMEYESEGKVYSKLWKFADRTGRIGWIPSIHMPKEVARIFLKVTDVRVERLQDITVEQSTKEGCESSCVMCGNIKHGKCSGNSRKLNDCLIDQIYSPFKELWDSTVKKSDNDTYGWDANPWVWVIGFERVEEKHERY